MITTPIFKRLVLMLLISFYVNEISAQTAVGKITESNNQPLQGVTVKVKDKTIVAVTDVNGDFSITATPGEVLVISYVGYVPQEIIVGVQPLLIKLENVNNILEDIVVVGYGTRQRKDIGGAVLSVDNRVMKDRPVTNAVAALQGAAPGLVITRTNGQPGNEGWTARIRGITTLGTQNAPLVIIDGVEGDLNAINPNDIADISILQDAASASIYGAKAGGGVILITTKAGRVNQKPRFEIQSLYTYRKPYARPEMLSSREEAELLNVAQFNVNGATPFNEFQLARFDNPDSSAVWNQAASNGAGAWEFFYNNRMIDILMREQSPQRNINLALSGGSEKSTYLFSVGYLDQQGVFKFGPDKYSRFNARLNYNTRFSKIFSFDSKLSFFKDNTLAPQQGVAGEGLLYNIYSIRAARNPIFVPGTTDKYIAIGTISNAYPILKDGGYNERDRYNINGVFTLNANQVLRGLNMKLSYSPGIIATNQVLFSRTVPRWNYVGQAGNLTPGVALNAPNSVIKTRPLTFNQTFFATADYRYKIGQHSFDLLGGYEFKTYRFDQIAARQNALLLNDFPSLNYTTLAFANTTNVSDNIQTNSWISYFGKLSYNFNQKYYLEGTVRRDGSSRLAPGNKFQTFASGLVFWRLTQEDWFKNALPWINEFKLSAAYGSLGGAQTADPNINNYDFQAFLSQGFYPFNDARTAYLFQNVLPAESKAWEVIKSADFGLKMEMMKNRLGIEFNYFIKRNDNVFVVQQLPDLLGVGPNQANLAGIEVKGWGVQLNWRDNFHNGSYFVSANLSDDKNKVTRYDGTQTYNTGINSALVGYSTNSIFGYKADGYFDNLEERKDAAVINPNVAVGDIKHVDINGDGIINTGLSTKDNLGDLVYLGNTNPRYNFGLNAGVNWKGFDFSFLVNGVGKRYILINSIASIAFFDGWRMPWKIHQDYWTPENPDARFPRLSVGNGTGTTNSNNAAVSSHWVQNASYIRLKNVQLGYTLTKQTHKLKFLNDVRLYVNGQDLWEKTGMWFNYYDPENTDNVSFGYPLWRSYSVGLNIVF